MNPVIKPPDPKTVATNTKNTFNRRRDIYDIFSVSKYAVDVSMPIINNKDIFICLAVITGFILCRLFLGR